VGRDSVPLLFPGSLGGNGSLNILILLKVCNESSQFLSSICFCLGLREHVRLFISRSCVGGLAEKIASAVNYFSGPYIESVHM